jgi:hypothetical protein
MINRKEGRKIAMSATTAPTRPFGEVAIPAPRYAVNVKSGPGTAWAAP